MRIKHTLGIINAKTMDQMSSDEIRKIVTDCRAANITFLAQVKSQKKQIEHPKRIKENKKMIARGLTVLVRRKERCV